MISQDSREQYRAPRGDSGVARLASIEKWLSRKFFYIIGVWVIGVSLVRFYQASYDESGLFGLLGAVVTFLLMTWFWLRRISRASSDKRFEQISLIFVSNPARAKIAEELYRSAEYYQERAQNNSISSIIVLVSLALAVAFAGHVLTFDSIQFSSIDKFESELGERRALIKRIYLSDQKDQEQAKEAISSLKPLETGYANALDKETDVEASSASPTSRIIGAFIIRISILGVGIYLVVLLNRSYKFNSNLSSFYRARFIASLREDDSIESFAKFSTFLSAETIEYKVDDIEHPSERLIAIFEKITAVFARERPAEQGQNVAHRHEHPQATSGPPSSPEPNPETRKTAG
jgi:flagellar biogenesis protein FliO